MNDENDINPLNSILARKIKVLNLKKREIARNRRNASKISQEHDLRLNSSDSTNSIIDNSYSDTEFEIEKISNFLKPTALKSTSENNIYENSVKKTSCINSSKTITIISEEIIKKPCFKFQSTTNISKLSEDLETTINKNINHPDLKEFDAKITVELLENLSNSEENVTASSNDQSNFFDLRDITDMEIINEHNIDALNEIEGSTFETSDVVCIDDVNAIARNAESTKDKFCGNNDNTCAKDTESTPEKKDLSLSGNIIAPTENAESTLGTTSFVHTNCSNDVNASAEYVESIPETKENINCSDDVNTTAEDPESTHKSNNLIACEDAVAVLFQDDSSSKKYPKRKTASKFTKSCIDFLLQEDLDDFSDGSSDLWSPKDSDSDNITDEEKRRKNKKLKKYRQKEKRDEIKEQAPPSIKKQKRQNQVKKRKELKQKGLTYETSSGKIKEPRRLKKNPCIEGKCIRKCFEIPEERRQSLFNYFWNLNDQQKKEFIVQCTRRQTVKRKKTDAAISRRSKTYEYFINEGEGRRQVCQQFLLNSLDISQTYLLYNVANIEEGISQPDQRRRYAVNKYDESTKQFAKDYIERLPVLPSHYSRKNSNRLYLPQEFKNLSNLYRLYKKHCENEKVTFLSERLFANLFRTEYNIAFHIPKKDKCKFCTKYENTEEKTLKDLEEYKVHKEEKKATYKRCEIHRNLVGTTILTASFDLQKVLNTPHGESMILYYSRKYTVYNLTVYESKTQNGYCYTWGEADGKRGSAEIGTCLNKYLKTVDSRGIKYLILYCDSCSGQNKNKIILSVLRNFLETSINLEVIQINYLLPGHTYMPVDSMHSVIEREVRNIIVWSPAQWPTLMQTARKTPSPYEVNVLDHTDFIDWQIKANEIFTAETVSNKDFKIKNLRVATFKKQNLDIMEVKYTMKEDGDTYKIPLKLAERRKPNKKGVRKCKLIQNENRSFDEISTRLYPTRLPISLLKYKDLKKLCEDGTIPKIFHKDYLTLPYDTRVIDTVSENEEEIPDIENTENFTFGNKSTQEDEDIPSFDNILGNKRKITKEQLNTEELKTSQENTPQKRIKMISKELDTENEKLMPTHEKRKNIVPKMTDKNNEKERKVVKRQERKGRGKGRGKGK